MIRARFKLPSDEVRPTEWPIRYPYWRTGYYGDGITVVAYVESVTELLRLWPEAEDVNVEEGATPPLFTIRFPKPAWYTEDGSHMNKEQELQQLEAPLLKEMLNSATVETIMIYEDENPLLFAEIEQLPDQKFTVRVKAGRFFIHRGIDSDFGRCYKAHRFTTSVGLL